MNKEKRMISIDADLLDAVTNELLQVEAWAQGLQEKCYKTRKLIQQAAGVSTPAKGGQVLSKEELAALSSKRKKRLLKGK